jgi:hypothetical protein
MAKMFPSEFGKELGGKTFEHVFVTNPKVIEFVTTWTDNCTGLFTEFRQYVMERLQNPFQRDEHENRCAAYVKGKTNLPGYLTKYSDGNRISPRIE